MWTRIQIWRVRRKARVVSRYTSGVVGAAYGNPKDPVIVGKFQRGREVK